MAAITSQARIAVREAATIAEWLSSDALDTLLTAKDRLDQNRPKAMEVLSDLMHQDARAYRSSKRRFWTLLVGGSALAALAIYCDSIWAGGTFAWVPYLLMPGWLAFPFLMAWYCKHQARKRRLRNTVALLRRYEDSNAIGALVEAMECGEAEAAFQAEKALTLLLQDLRPADRARLSKAHRAPLHRALYGYNSNLILAILHAFEQVGDPMDILHIRHLTACPEWIAYSRQIRNAATRCLSVLEQRAEREWGKRTYLRAVYAPSPNEMLLRAAQEGGPILPHHLLRTAPMRELP